MLALLPRAVGAFVPTMTETAGQKLERYLARAKMQQKELAAKLGVEPSYISRMVTDKIGWAHGRYFGQIAAALNLTDDEIRELNPAAVVTFSPAPGLRPAHGPEDMRGLTPYRPTIEVRHLGKVAAGRTGSVVYDHIETRKIPDDIANGYNPEDLFTLDVAGNSMTCPDVRFEIPCGATVVMHSGLQPEPGDIVSVWLTNEEIGVLKMFKTIGGHTVLESYNREHKPIVIDDSTPAIMQGVMVGQWKPRHRRQGRG